jgi:DNA-binding transcriptional ArsR family regulator
MPQLALEGRVEPDEVGALRRKVARLESEISDMESMLLSAKQDTQKAQRALVALRQTLSPLHKVLLAIFGELDSAEVYGDEGKYQSSTPTAADDPRIAAVWQAWKHRLGTTASKVIDALLLHGEMNTSQIAIASGLSRKTVPTGIYQLKQAGLINKNGGRFSLKEL